MLLKWLLLWHVVCISGQQFRQQSTPNRQFFPQRFLPGMRRNPTHLILASKTVRPGSVFSVVVNMLEPSATTDILASISRDGVEIAAAQTTISGVDTERLLLKIPTRSTKGQYKLRVEGQSNDILGPQFVETQDLAFSPRFLTIVVHTNRAVYNADQIALIRVIILNMDMKPYNEPATINILVGNSCLTAHMMSLREMETSDPNGNIMASFRSVQLNVGVGTVKYTIPKYPPVGWWKIQVLTYSQLEEYKFVVEKFYNPRYEIDVTIPEFLINTEETLAGEIGAAYLAEGQIVGNMTISLYAQGPGRNDKPLLINEEYVPYFAGSHEFEYDLEEVRRVMPLVAGSKLKIEGVVFEQFFQIVYPCWAFTTVIESKVVLQFLGPNTKVFKAGMPFRIYIAASYNDLAPLPEEKSTHAIIEVIPAITLSNGQRQQLQAIYERVPENGVIKVEFDVPHNAKFMILRAKYQDSEEESQTVEVGVVSATPKEDRAIYVYITDSSADIGEYIVVHVQANFYIHNFQYLVIAKGVIVHSAKEEVEPLRNPIKTISIPVSSSMAPSFEVLVYHITRDGFIFADSVSVPINKFDRQKPNLRVNPYKDKTGNTVELGVIHIPGSFYGITARDAIAFCHKCGADLTKASVLENLFGFNDEPDRITKMKWAHRGTDPDQVLYYDTPNAATNAPETFKLSGIVVFTDGQLIPTDSCNRSLGYLPCHDGHCYPARKRCDGNRDCSSGYDEIGCGAPRVGLDMDLTLYRIYRKSRTEQFYDEEGDWGWIDFNTDDDDFFNREVPVRPSPWFVTGFAMNTILGLSIQDDPILYNGVRPFFMTIEMPERCKRGEQIGVRVDVFNDQSAGIFVTVVLRGSEDYKVIHVEEEGFVSSYSPRMSFGEHQHQTWIEPYDQVVVYIPIVFTRLGEIEVAVEVWTPLAKGEDSVTVTVVPDGAKQRLHTSMMLDLKTHPYLIKYLDINVTETPIIPYQKWRRYVFGSPQSHLSLVGDVFGPVYEPEKITTDVLLDKPFHTAEALAFTFGANVWMLHYLRLTNQLTKTMLHQSFQHMRYYYGCVMNFRNPDGSFSMWERFGPSLWLTAYVTNVFQQAVFSDWENIFYIDPNVISKAVEYLLRHQTPEGAFVEVSKLHLNTKFDPSSKYLRQARHRNIPLTAFILITLGEIEDIPGEIRIKAATAKVRAMHFLEQNLHTLSDPYEIAIVTYALTLVNSVEQEEAFRKLDKIKFLQEGRAYWSRQARPQSDVYYDNQRPLQLPRLPIKDDALSVEASAYALLVYIAKEGLIQEHIVRWLNTMRNNDGGFISSQDTLVAMQALTEFTFRARLREITDMRVTMRPSSNPELESTLKITPDNLANLQIIDIPNVWGHVEATAKGAGYAITQLDVSYSVDRPELLIKPPQRAFDLNIDLRYFGRNNSHINIRACQRWILQNEARHSGVAVFEMDVPTGYYQDKPKLFDYVYSRKVPNLRRMAITDRKIYAYFDYLDGNYTCINFDIQRWYPVANLSQYNLVKIYEYHSPERYNESIFQAYPLYVMDVCQVCGSYQCPYCPYYSDGPLWGPNTLLTLMCLVSSIICGTGYLSDAISNWTTISNKLVAILYISKRMLVMTILLFVTMLVSIRYLRIEGMVK